MISDILSHAASLTSLLSQTFRIRAFYVFLASLFLLCHASAQSPVGTIDPTTANPILGTGHDYIQSLNETVNPVSGSVSVRIAAPVPEERGLNLPIFAYVYDTSGQFQLIPGFVPGGNSGYAQLVNSYTLFGSGYVSTGGSTLTGAPAYQNNQTSQSLQVPGTLSRQIVSLTSGSSHTCTYATSYVYTDNSGGRHPLGMMYMAPAFQNANSCGFFGVSEAVITTGGDGIIFGVLDPSSSNGDAYVYDIHGNQLNPDYNVEDTNGNYLNGTGRQYGGSYSSGSSPTSITIPGLGGEYSFTYPSTSTSTLPIDLNPVGVGNPSNCPTTFTNQTTAPTGSTIITLPNQQTYKIDFDPTFGLIQKITYPTGATVAYTWTYNTSSQYSVISKAGSDSCAYKYDWPALKSRVVSYDGNTPALKQEFSYTTTWGSNSWTAKTTTVTTTDLLSPGMPKYDTVYSYVPSPVSETPSNTSVLFNKVPVEQSIVYKDTSGNTLQTITKSWLNSNQLLAECTTLPNGLTAGRFYS